MHNHHSVVQYNWHSHCGRPLRAYIIGCMTICVIVLAAGATQTYHRSQNPDKHLVI